MESPVAEESLGIVFPKAYRQLLNYFLNAFLVRSPLFAVVFAAIILNVSITKGD